MRESLSKEEMQAEIDRLKQSPYVKLGRKAEKAKRRQKNMLYSYRYLEKKGRELAEAGYTLEDFDMREPPDYDVIF